jgi:phage/plasmid-like protein (TIGR03299 family)
VEIPGQKLVERSDNSAPLGVVTDSFGIVTNDEMWDVAEAVGQIASGDSELGDVKIETAGSLRGGRNVWILLRFIEPLQVAGDPNGATLAFFALQNGHAATGSFRGQGINTRIVCANTSAAADAEAKASGYEFTFKHTKNVSERVELAKAAVSMWRANVEAWQNAMDHLIHLSVDARQVEEFVQRFQPMPPQHLLTDKVRGNVETARSELRSILDGPTCVGINRSAYGLFQAGIEWSQHYRRTKGVGETEAERAQARMESHFRRSMLDDGGVRKSTFALAKAIAS